jgi:hypothetical protein
MAWVNLDHGYPSCLSFVGQEAMELGKRPAMEASFIPHVLVLLASSYLAVLTNVRQILKHHGTARSGVLHEAFGEDMVMVTTLPKQLTRKLLQVPCGRPRALLLELASEAKDAAFLFLPGSLTQELAITGDSGAVHAQVNADHFFTGSNDGSRESNHDVEKVASLVKTQVSTTDLATNIRGGVFGNAETQRNTAGYRGKATGERVPLDPVGTLVITNRRTGGLWATHRMELRWLAALLPGFLDALGIGCLMLLGPGERTLDGFCGFDTGRTHELCRQVRKQGAKGKVRPFVQFYAIATGRAKALLGHRIKAGGMLLKGGLERACLCWRGRELYHYRPIHTKKYHIYQHIVNDTVHPCARAPRKEDFLIPCLKAWGFRKSQFYEPPGRLSKETSFLLKTNVHS